MAFSVCERDPRTAEGSTPGNDPGHIILCSIWYSTLILVVNYRQVMIMPFVLKSLAQHKLLVFVLRNLVSKIAVPKGPAWKEGLTRRHICRIKNLTIQRSNTGE